MGKGEKKKTSQKSKNCDWKNFFLFSQFLQKKDDVHGVRKDYKQN